MSSVFVSLNSAYNGVSTFSFKQQALFTCILLIITCPLWDGWGHCQLDSIYSPRRHTSEHTCEGLFSLASGHAPKMAQLTDSKHLLGTPDDLRQSKHLPWKKRAASQKVILTSDFKNRECCRADHLNENGYLCWRACAGEQTIL